MCYIRIYIYIYIYIYRKTMNVEQVWNIDQVSAYRQPSRPRLSKHLNAIGRIASLRIQRSIQAARAESPRQGSSTVVSMRELDPSPLDNPRLESISDPPHRRAPIHRITCIKRFTLHPVSITRFPLRRFSPGAGLLRYVFFIGSG